MKKLFAAMFDSAMDLNRATIVESLDPQPEARLLDLGCDEGSFTTELGAQLGSSRLYGIEIVSHRANEAARRGVEVVVADLNRPPYPFDDDSFDVIHSNQVIEHVNDVDAFVTEIHRLLKPGGYTLISTENGSSWHNIAAAVFGWQTFSSANFAPRHGSIGNPLSIHGGVACELASWGHKIIFNYRGLKALCEATEFDDIDIAGAGYYPLPARVGRFDPRHAHFLVVKATKPLPERTPTPAG